MYKKKKGLSPIITTVILIALVIAIISIVFFWFRGMVEEGVTKFGKNIQLVCEDIEFKATYENGMLSLVNEGNIPIYNINVKITKDGNYETIDLRTNLAWPSEGLRQGIAKEINIGQQESDQNLELTPVLVGTSQSGKKMFICGGQYGKILEI